ncbi:helix-turn-helix domain-containing protein [Cohnella thailandensis]|uniref:Helix-turn-helix domain-containing protein n=1 Tax=Cohnella thailandensis TaxID=557557 RepID=A0A841SXY7_9BACL|nr:helix-turn-helix domain-containing protein [Cohnella thailandensis]MBB6634467.1 helix-turn-helix domain-containing protein [Cohnella thailandensis]MBP1972979.1 AraC-like DNA-binding protein [Cohnella thailandensis]
MKRIPMKLQLALILFFVMAIPIAILTWYSGTQILRNSESAIAESSLAGMNANRRLNENALNNLAQDAVRLGSTNIFDRIRSFETYAELNSNYNYVSSALSVMKELVNLNHRVDGVASSYFLLDGADYVVSTDKGITTLDRYEDVGWMEEALEERRGISGVWYPRKLRSGTAVVSYVFPLNRLSTTTRGTIVVNLRERQIGSYLQSSEQGEQGYMLLDSDGTVISHNDKSLLLTDGTVLPYMKQVLGTSSREGYAFREQSGKRLLYTWSRSPLFDWWNVQIYSVDELMTKTYSLQRSIILITAIIILAGTLLAVWLATWFSKPIRELVRTLRSRGNLGVTNKNELVFLDSAFKRMQEEEEGLHRLLKERERDTRNLAAHHLLRGEVTEQVAMTFPAPYYMVVVVSIDRYRRYVSKNNPETRSYHRYLLTTQCESLFPEGMQARCVYQGEGTFAIVVNYGQEEQDKGLDGVKEALVRIRDGVLELLGHSVTIGASSPADSSSQVSERLAEATETIKRRMIQGSGCIFFWEPEPERSKKYTYPANSERRIVNFLESGDIGSILRELEIIREEIYSADSISYDNILFIYNQLVGVTIKHLRENNISTARIFAGRGNIYSAIASIDTLDELEKYLREFFAEIVQYLARNPSEASPVNHGERIIRYLEENYVRDIVFEDMAKEIGISYSYMRKIVYDLTGKSLIDYTNMLRIEKAKQLLTESELTITQIASEVGYFNVQSFNRFFRKFEGMPPSSYKASRARSS